MNKKDLEQDYARYEAFQKAYDEAQAAGNSEGMKAAQKGFQDVSRSINEKEETYSFMFRLYDDMRRRGNDCIDISEPYQYEDEAMLVGLLKDFGFERFTFSSRCSSAVESAWSFLQSGCALEGMAEINSKYMDFLRGRYEKVHAYVFRII